MRKVVITGGTRLMGNHLAELLVKEGYEVHVTGMFSKPVNTSQDWQTHVCDVRDVAAMRAVCDGAEFIFHLAALGNVIQEAIDHPIKTESVNVGGTVSLLEVAKEVNAKKFIFFSSAAVYGELASLPLSEKLDPLPMDPYGLYKKFGEELVRLWAESFGVPGVSLRIFNAYGRGNPVGQHELVIGRFLDLRMRGEPLTIVGDGLGTRDYVHAEDIARAALAAALTAPGKGEIYNIGSGVETTLNQLAELIGGPVVHVKSLDGSHAGPSRRVADISRAREELHWAPKIQLKEGLDELKRELNLT